MVHVLEYISLEVWGQNLWDGYKTQNAHWNVLNVIFNIWWFSLQDCFTETENNEKNICLKLWFIHWNKIWWLVVMTSAYIFRKKHRRCFQRYVIIYACFILFPVLWHHFGITLQSGHAPKADRLNFSSDWTNSGKKWFPRYFVI